MIASFLVPVLDDTVPVKVVAEYDGPVPSETCDYLAERIIGCSKNGLCYPAHPLDVYTDIWQKIEKTARCLPTLESAAATTYLHKAVDNAIRKYFKRHIQPMRDEYRATEGNLAKADAAAAAKAQHDAPEGKDVGYAATASAAEGYDYAKGSTSALPLTAQQLAAKLPGEAWARERRQKAAALLEEVYAAILNGVSFSGKRGRDAASTCVRAFRAYVAADGNMVEAAHLAHIPKASYYRKWRPWLTQARKAVSK